VERADISGDNRLSALEQVAVDQECRTLTQHHVRLVTALVAFAVVVAVAGCSLLYHNIG